MKVIMIDNFFRESYSYPDKLIKANLSKEEAVELAKKLNQNTNEYSDYVYMAVNDDRILQDYEP